MEKKVKMLPPTMPNFLLYETEVGKRQDGLKPKARIPVIELTRQEAEQYGELMKQAFIKHWEKKQENK